MTREELAENIIETLNNIATEVCPYEYGLPNYGDQMKEMMNATINWIAMYEDKKKES